MFGKIIFDTILDNIVGKVKKQNQEDPNVETADSSVFDNLLKKVKSQPEEVEASQETRSRQDLYRDFYEKMKETQAENEADPQVATADASVFEKMQAEIELLKAKVEAKEAKGDTDYTNWNYSDDDDFENYEAPTNPATTYQTPTGIPTSAKMAVTNSFGGSITLRMNPDMGAAQNVVRIPDQSLLKVVEYSDQKIILDGKESRWVKVDYNGNTGWILESYLNFN